MASRWIMVVLLLSYGVLLIITSIAYWQGRAYNDPDGGNSDEYNPIIEGDGYHAPGKLPILLSSDTRLALSLQAATAGKIEAARHHAVDALRSNPAHGEAALMLLDLYARPSMYRLYAPIEETQEATEATEETEESSDENDRVASENEMDADMSPPNDMFTSLAPAERLLTDKLADMSLNLRPTHIATLSALAEYWLAQNEQEKAIQIWAVLLVNHPTAANEAFPVFHKAMESPETATIFQHYMQTPPKWWEAFFRYLLEHEVAPEKLHQYYLTRSQSNSPPTMIERDSYIDYLVKNKNWSAAYQIWHERSDKKLTDGLLSDGGFEHSDDENGFFSWKIQPLAEAKIKPENATGGIGKKSLHITFKKGNSILFQHISQIRLLTANHYTLKGRYRVDKLKTNKGLRWRVHCIHDESNIIGETEPFKGSTGWKTFQMEFSVPDECKVQMIRLESDSQYAHHNTFEGGIWFDDLSIQARK